jgi:hypothetical protein
MVFMEIEFDITRENVEAFDAWMDKKPKCVTKIRLLSGEELDLLEQEKKK